MRIDAHHHFWRYNSEEYGWMSDEMAILRRDFLPPDLQAEIGRAGIDGVVSVQARQRVAETEWLLQLAEEHSFILGVVGWIPLTAPDAGEIAARLSLRRKLRAVRHVLHDEPDEFYMLRDDFNHGVAALGPAGLAYDILIFERHLPQTIQFVKRHPNQSFVLDHIAKPRIRDGVLSPWKENIAALAKHENVFCKFSGMVTEANWGGWTEGQLRPYFDTVLEAFGPSRLMFGSDWPVCLMACDYLRWHQVVARSIETLSPDEQAQILGGTAARAYHLDDV